MRKRRKKILALLLEGVRAKTPLGPSDARAESGTGLGVPGKGKLMDDWSRLKSSVKTTWCA